MNRDLYSHNHNKGIWEYHLEWCPKYRKSIFEEEGIRRDCEEILRQAAKAIGLDVLELAVMPDHVHMISLSRKPADVGRVLFYLKGRSAYELFKKHPALRRQYWRGHLWSRGNFSRTVGLDVDKTRSYVRNQSDIHQTKLTNYTEAHAFRRG